MRIPALALIAALAPVAPALAETDWKGVEAALGRPCPGRPTQRPGRAGRDVRPRAPRHVGTRDLEPDLLQCPVRTNLPSR